MELPLKLVLCLLTLTSILITQAFADDDDEPDEEDKLEYSKRKPLSILNLGYLKSKKDPVEAWFRSNENSIEIKYNNQTKLHFTLSSYFIPEALFEDKSLAMFQPNRNKYCHRIFPNDMHRQCNASGVVFERSNADYQYVSFKIKWANKEELCLALHNKQSNFGIVEGGTIVNNYGKSSYENDELARFNLTNSNGFWVILNEKLQTSWNSSHLCFTAQVNGTRKTSHSMVIHVNNLKEAYKHVQSKYSNKQLSPIYPNIREFSSVNTALFTNPIWSYSSKNLSMLQVLSYASSVKNHFNASLLEISADWQRHDGDFQFDSTRMPDPKLLISEIHQIGLNISLPIRPFVSQFSPNFERLRYPMSNFSNNSNVFDDSVGGVFNLSRTAVSKWFLNKCSKLSKSMGIDFYQLGAGKFGSFNEMVLQQGRNNSITSDNSFSFYYHAAASSLKSQSFPLIAQINIKAGPNFARNIKLVIPMALSASLAGHSYVAPNLMFDDESLDKPSEELYIRWVQASALMPIMKFSIPPWLYNQSIVELVNKFINLHTQFSQTMIELETTKFSTKSNFSLIIRPLWYVYPSDPKTYLIQDQFMLGDQILVAPVLQEGQRERTVYFPKGVWLDQHDGFIHGPAEHKIQTPIDELPYFELFESEPINHVKSEL